MDFSAVFTGKLLTVCLKGCSCQSVNSVFKMDYILSLFALFTLLFTHIQIQTQKPTQTCRLTDVMLAAATISLFLISLLQRTIVTRDTTHTPTSGLKRRMTFHGSSKGSLQHTQRRCSVSIITYFTFMRSVFVGLFVNIKSFVVFYYSAVLLSFLDGECGMSSKGHHRV